MVASRPTRRRPRRMLRNVQRRQQRNLLIGIEAVKDGAQAVKDKVVCAAVGVKGTASDLAHRGVETVKGGATALKDTVVNAGCYATEAVKGGAETVKEFVTGTGEETTTDVVTGGEA